MSRIGLKYGYIFLCLMLLSILAFPQDPARKINPSRLNQSFLAELVKQRINRDRRGQGLQTLQLDSILTLAATNHVRYCWKKSTLSHLQSKKKLKLPWNRVHAYGGIHPFVDELIAYVPELKGESYIGLAEAIFREFEKDKNQLALLRSKDLHLTGMRFIYDRKKEAFYAVAVVSGVPWHMPEVDIPSWSRKMKPSNPIYCDYFKNFNFITAHLANGIRQKGNELYLYFRDLNTFKKILKDNNTMVAVDIMDKSQFHCEGHNLLHGSPGHDGVILRPLNRKRLLRKNLLRKKGEFLALIGEIQEGLKGDLQFNTVILHHRRTCKYSYPLPVETGEFPPVFVPLPLDTAGASESPQKRKRYLEFRVPFEVNKFDYKPSDIRPLLDSVSNLTRNIKRIEIRAYASVEGPTEINNMLQERRARSIYNAIQTVQKEKIGFKKFTAEDWTGFYRDISGTTWSWLATQSRSTIKDTLARDLMLHAALEHILSEHRRADIRVFLEEEIWDTLSPAAWRDSLQARIDAGKPQKALELQTKMIEAFLNGDFAAELTQVDIPIKKEFLPLLFNSIVIYEREKSGGEIAPVPYQYQDLLALDKEYLYARFLRAKAAVEFWYATADTSKGKPPSGLQKEIFRLEKEGIDPVFTSKLNINYHLGNARQARRMLDTRVLLRSMNLIRKSFSGAALSEEETLKLARFFNMNYLYEWALQLMQPWVDHPEKLSGEEIMFTFLKNAALYPEKIGPEKLADYYEKAAKIDKKRLCEKAEKEYQLLRVEPVKRLVCEICEGL